MSGRIGNQPDAWFTPGDDPIANVKRAHRNLIPFWFSTAATAPTGRLIKSGPGELGELQIVGGTLGAIEVFDGTSTSGVLLLSTTPTAGGVILLSDIVFNVGLFMTVATAMQLRGRYS